MKFHSIIAFCGISTFAAVYYYYQYITESRKRKQTSANRFLAFIKQENKITSDDLSTTNCNSSSVNTSNKGTAYNILPNPTPDIITDHLTSIACSTKELTEKKIHDNHGFDKVDEDLIAENCEIVKEVETVCSAAIPAHDSKKFCTEGSGQATACKLGLKVDDGPGQGTVECTTPAAVCEFKQKNLSLFIGANSDSNILLEQESALKDINYTVNNCSANMCDEIVTKSSHNKTDKSGKEEMTATSPSSLTSTESTGIESGGACKDNLSNGYISWASIVEESLKEQSDPVLDRDIHMNTPYVLETSIAVIAYPSNHTEPSSASDKSISSGSTNSKDNSSCPQKHNHATESKANPKKPNKGSSNNQKLQNTNSQQVHSLTPDSRKKLQSGGKNKQQFSTSQYQQPSVDSCSKQSPSSVSANDRNRHSSNSKSSLLAKCQNVTSPSKTNSSLKQSQYDKQTNSSNSQQKTNRQANNQSQYGNECNNKNATSSKNSLLSVDCNEANLNNTKQKSTTPNTKTTPTFKSADSRSNQENDPSRNSLRAKKSGGEKRDEAAKIVPNHDEFSKQNGHSTLDQIYLNDPSVISVISPSNYSEAG